MLRFLTLAGLAVRAANMRGMIRAVLIRAALAAIGFICVIAAACFGLFAGYIALAPLLGPIGAAGAIGGVLLLVGVAILLFSRRTSRRPSSTISGDVSAGVKEQYERATRALSTGSPYTNPILWLAGAALIAGYLAGRGRGKKD